MEWKRLHQKCGTLSKSLYVKIINRMNKYGLAIVVLMVTFFFSCNQGNKSNKVETVDSADVVVPVTIDEQNQLSEVITKFLRAYASKDNAKANALIHPELGIYIIYRPGAADTFVRNDSLDFNNPVPEVFAYPDLDTEYALTFEALPSYDC